MVHIDPEDEEEGPTTAHLPLRSRFHDQLKEAWQGCSAADQIRKYNLHYLNGQIELEIFLPLEALDDSAQNEQIRTELVQASRTLDFIGKVRVYYT
jgi:hypothetical protein